MRVREIFFGGQHGKFAYVFEAMDILRNKIYAIQVIIEEKHGPCDNYQIIDFEWQFIGCVKEPYVHRADRIMDKEEVEMYKEMALNHAKSLIKKERKISKYKFNVYNNQPAVNA